jgi:hypothetical protein
MYGVFTYKTNFCTVIFRLFLIVCTVDINRVSNIGAKPFTDIETAKEWLVQD